MMRLLCILIGFLATAFLSEPCLAKEDSGVIRSAKLQIDHMIDVASRRDFTGDPIIAADVGIT